MNQNLVYVGIDVDDVSYHGSALDRHTGEVLDFRCRPTLKGLVGQLAKANEYFGGARLKLCYEAPYVGFSLQRHLQERSYECEVVAPSSIPRRAGKSVKTDRIDAGDLRRHILSLLRRNGLHYKAECSSKTNGGRITTAGWKERLRVVTVA